MATLPEIAQWVEGIYQLEVSDPVMGGLDGIDNKQAKELASRTLYLKQAREALTQIVATQGSDKVDKTALSDSVTSSSSTNVASSKAVKTLNDRTNNAQAQLNNKVSKTGDNISGKLLAADTYYPFENQNTTPADYTKVHTCTIARAVMPSFGLFGGLYIEQNKKLNHSIVIELIKPGNGRAWKFCYDGHVYGLHGRIVVESELNTKADKSDANKKIDKTAISDSVTSSSSTNVASSKAVKAAYDKVKVCQGTLTSKADKKECQWSGGVIEFAAVDVGYREITVDCPAPYVMVGLRSQTKSFITYIRGIKLRNY